MDLSQINYLSNDNYSAILLIVVVVHAWFLGRVLLGDDRCVSK